MVTINSGRKNTSLSVAKKSREVTGSHPDYVQVHGLNININFNLGKAKSNFMVVMTYVLSFTHCNNVNGCQNHVRSSRLRIY